MIERKGSLNCTTNRHFKHIRVYFFVIFLMGIFGLGLNSYSFAKNFPKIQKSHQLLISENYFSNFVRIQSPDFKEFPDLILTASDLNDTDENEWEKENKDNLRTDAPCPFNKNNFHFSIQNLETNITKFNLSLGGIPLFILYHKLKIYTKNH